MLNSTDKRDLLRFLHLLEFRLNRELQAAKADEIRMNFSDFPPEERNRWLPPIRRLIDTIYSDLARMGELRSKLAAGKKNSSG